jgi:hypothetical protein
MKIEPTDTEVCTERRADNWCDDRACPVHGAKPAPMKIRVTVFSRTEPMLSAEGELNPTEWLIDAAARICRAKLGYSGGYFTETYGDHKLKAYMNYAGTKIRGQP